MFLSPLTSRELSWCSIVPFVWSDVFPSHTSLIYSHRQVQLLACKRGAAKHDGHVWVFAGAALMLAPGRPRRL